MSFDFIIRLLLCVIAVGIALWYEIPKYFDDIEVDRLIEQNETVRDVFASSALQSASSSYDAVTGKYVWGRTMHPTFSFDTHPLNFVQSYTQLKEFAWVSVTSGPWLAAFAVFQLEYLALLVMQVYHRGEEGEHGPLSLQGSRAVPLLPQRTGYGGVWVANGKGQMGPTAEGHSVLFNEPQFPWTAAGTRQPRANLTFSDGQMWFDVEVPLRSRTDNKKPVAHLSGAAHVPAALMGLVFPLGPRRASMVSKFAAATASQPVRLSLSDSEGVTHVNFENPLIAIDYTRGMLKRETKWYWSCLTSPDGLGLHLSSGAYDVDGVSVESSVYDARTGHAYFLDEGVSFTQLHTADSTEERWKVQSASVDLVFTAADHYDGAQNLGVVNMQMKHKWGLYSGSFRYHDQVVEVHDVPGVLEDHFALW